MKIIETTEMEDGGLQVTVEVEAHMLPALAALGLKYAVVSAAMLEMGNVVDDAEINEPNLRTNEPDLETVNRILGTQVQKLMDELKEADRENRRLRAELAEAQRVADLERGRA